MSLSLGGVCGAPVLCWLGEHEDSKWAKMLSALSRGYSTWNGELDVYGEALEKPVINSFVSSLES